MYETATVTLAEIHALAPLVDAVHRNAKITIAVDGDVSRLLTGTLRTFTPESGSSNYPSSTANVWGLYVRVSATFEHWFTVRELMAALNDGTAAIDY